jgi:hypothetical protein
LLTAIKKHLILEDGRCSTTVGATFRRIEKIGRTSSGKKSNFFKLFIKMSNF